MQALEHVVIGCLSHFRIEIPVGFVGITWIVIRGIGFKSIKTKGIHFDEDTTVETYRIEFNRAIGFLGWDTGFDGFADKNTDDRCAVVSPGEVSSTHINKLADHRALAGLFADTCQVFAVGIFPCVTPGRVPFSPFGGDMKHGDAMRRSLGEPTFVGNDCKDTIG